MKTDRDGRLTTGCRSNRLVTKQRNCKPPWFQPANWSKWFNESLQRPASKGQPPKANAAIRPQRIAHRKRMPLQ